MDFAKRITAIFNFMPPLPLCDSFYSIKTPPKLQITTRPFPIPDDSFHVVLKAHPELPEEQGHILQRQF